MSYEFLEHPSDIIVLGKNSTFESALEDVANGMFTQMGAEDAEEKESFDLEFSAPTNEQLVVQLLTEVIAECETMPLTPKRMEVLGFRLPVPGAENDFRISVRVHGERKVPENIIKAVTYNSLRIEENEDWEIEVLFDI